jgi:hypothetical protein
MSVHPGIAVRMRTLGRGLAPPNGSALPVQSIFMMPCCCCRTLDLGRCSPIILRRFASALPNGRVPALQKFSGNPFACLNDDDDDDDDAVAVEAPKAAAAKQEAKKPLTENKPRPEEKKKQPAAKAAADGEAAFSSERAGGGRGAPKPGKGGGRGSGAPVREGKREFDRHSGTGRGYAPSPRTTDAFKVNATFNACPSLRATSPRAVPIVLCGPLKCSLAEPR